MFKNFTFQAVILLAKIGRYRQLRWMKQIKRWLSSNSNSRAKKGLCYFMISQFLLKKSQSLSPLSICIESMKKMPKPKVRSRLNKKTLRTKSSNSKLRQRKRRRWTPYSKSQTSRNQCEHTLITTFQSSNKFSKSLSCSWDKK